MFVIIGIVVVFGAVVAGYLMEHGNLKVLIQPAELIIIGGAAIGTVLIAIISELDRERSKRIKAGADAAPEVFLLTLWQVQGALEFRRTAENDSAGICVVHPSSLDA